MEENVVKKESKFVDNVAYKNKFQFLLWVNDNVICQRYFKINGFIEDSIYSEDFQRCMNEIVKDIQEDLKSKSNVFMWYTNSGEPLKLLGFLTDKEVEEFGHDFFCCVANRNIVGEIERPDGKTMTKEYFDYPEGIINDFGDTERLADGEFTFRFSFLIDDVPVYEKVWDGNVYPRFVRNGVDLTNSFSLNNKDINQLPFGQQLVNKMQSGKINLINDFIHRICNTLSNTFTEKYKYTKTVVYDNNNTINKEKYEEAVKYYGVIKPVVTGHTDIKPVTKTYDFMSNIESYTKSWDTSVKGKTKDYFYSLYPGYKKIEYWESR